MIPPFHFLPSQGGPQLSRGQEDRLRQLWRAAAGQEPLQQRARGHQAGADEVEGAAAAPGIPLLQADRQSRGRPGDILLRPLRQVQRARHGGE